MCSARSRTFCPPWNARWPRAQADRRAMLEAVPITDPSAEQQLRQIEQVRSDPGPDMLRVASQDAAPVVLGNHDVAIGGGRSQRGDVVEIPDVPAEALVLMPRHTQSANCALSRKGQHEGCE